MNSEREVKTDVVSGRGGRTSRDSGKDVNVTLLLLLVVGSARVKQCARASEKATQVNFDRSIKAFSLLII